MGQVLIYACCGQSNYISPSTAHYVLLEKLLKLFSAAARPRAIITWLFHLYASWCVSQPLPIKWRLLCQVVNYNSVSNLAWYYFVPWVKQWFHFQSAPFIVFMRNMIVLVEAADCQCSGGAKLNPSLWSLIDPTEGHNLYTNTLFCFMRRSCVQGKCK